MFTAGGPEDGKDTDGRSTNSRSTADGRRRESGPGASGTGSAASRLARSASAAPVTYGLIALCSVVFLISPLSGLHPGYGTGDELLTAQRDYFARWGVIPTELLGLLPRSLLTPVTALFVHGTWLHLLGNMLFLYVFGAMAEQTLGSRHFLVFYAVTGALALIGYATAHPGSAQTLIGASGAVSAVLGAFLRLHPRARVTSLFPFLFFLPLRFPAWMVLPFWVALQWLAVSRSPAGASVAYLAHLIGFALGFLHAVLWLRRRDRRPAVGAGPQAAPLE